MPGLPRAPLADPQSHLLLRCTTLFCLLLRRPMARIAIGVRRCSRCRGARLDLTKELQQPGVVLVPRNATVTPRREVAARREERVVDVGEDLDWLARSAQAGHRASVSARRGALWVERFGGHALDEARLGPDRGLALEVRERNPPLLLRHVQVHEPVEAEHVAPGVEQILEPQQLRAVRAAQRVERAILQLLVGPKVGLLPLQRVDERRLLRHAHDLHALPQNLGDPFLPVLNEHAEVHLGRVDERDEVGRPALGHLGECVAEVAPCASQEGFEEAV
mmetsp:Transcript_4933/g.16029  ORF Transcript_4933/g.16029 Transcript_4933/m.16029 type:complete len:277 (+) Transcript_4933:1083-1913(+)